MKLISKFWDEVQMSAQEKPAHRGNEAELTKVVVQYKINGILKERSVLLRECIFGDKFVHNAEIKAIYERLESINDSYAEKGLLYRVNLVKHFTDEDDNIYVKDLNPSGEIYVYDLLPDGYYMTPEKKDRSKFWVFKKAVKEMRLDRPEIVVNIFEQLAILHANGFVVGKLHRNGKEMNHPTLSLFLCRLKNDKSLSGNSGTKIFVHDIHNLELFQGESPSRLVKSCVRDLQDLSLDMIRYFKGIGLPQWGFRKYGETLRVLNPDFYYQIYEAFLWDPKIEIESAAIYRAEIWEAKEKKETKKILSAIEQTPIDKSTELRKLLRSDGIFILQSKKKKVKEFLEGMTPDNTEFIFDFDGTLTKPGSRNAFNVAFDAESGMVVIDQESSDGFEFRMGAIPLLKMLLGNGYEAKIHSLGFSEIITEALKIQGMEIPESVIFGNSPDRLVQSKKSVPLLINKGKRQVIIGDNPVDFDIETPNETLKIGFSSRKRGMEFNSITDFYHLESAGDFLHLYYLFREYMKVSW